jgi:hypothetical protein
MLLAIAETRAIAIASRRMQRIVHLAHCDHAKRTKYRFFVGFLPDFRSFRALYERLLRLRHVADA